MTSTRQSTSLLKKYIAEKFGIKASVKSDKYSGGSSMRISNGQIYDTAQTEIKKELKTVEREATIILNDVKLVDYSEKAVAVIGNTYEIKDELKELGGRFNRFLTVEGSKVAGWVFSKGKADEIADFLIKYSQQ